MSSATSAAAVPSVKSDASPPRSIASSIRAAPRRVVALVGALVTLFAYSVAAEGVAGVVTFVVGMVLIPVFWVLVWHLKLKQIKVFQDVASVLFQVEEKKDKSRPGKTKVIRVD